jgi:hypothetical protein
VPSLRATLTATVRAELAAARLGARRRLASAEQLAHRAAQAHDAALARQAEAGPRLAEARQRALDHATARRTRRHTATAARLTDFAATLAGPAAMPWAQWQPSPPDRGSLPGLYRIGTLTGAGPDLPALVPLLDLGHVTVAGGSASAADGLIAGLLLRAVGAAPPGSVQIRVYDPERLGGALAGFGALAGAGLLRNARPDGLPELLDELVERIHRVTEQVLAGEYDSLRQLAATTGRRPEPWLVAVLLSGPHRPEQVAALERLARTGPACGVHLVTRGVALPGAVEIRLGTPVRTNLTGPLAITLDPPPPAALVTGTCRELAAGPPPAVFADLLPEKLWTESSADGLVGPVGEGPDGRLVEIALADHPPHALIAGPSGSGKTNLIYAWLAGLTARYSPDELELHLLDFKEGVSFARFAPGRRDPSWLPHVRLVGVNVNTDREFGLALLRFLLDELRRRAAAARRHEATKLAELRAEEPGGHWPRIVAVIDEFQVLLAGRDALTTEAVGLLEDLARRGRSQGIHLVLASQDVSGIEALWGRSGLISQFTLRIALPKARRILAETNLAAESIPRYHAVVNPDSGAPSANRVVRLADAGARDGWQALQTRLWQRRSPDALVPRLFDGDFSPPLPADATPHRPEAGPPVALVGEAIDVAGRPAILALPRSPGRNLAVLGTRTGDACAVLGAAGRTVAGQLPGARFSVVCLDPAALPAAQALAGALPLGSLYDRQTLPALLAGPLDGPHIIVGYALDAVEGPAEPLRRILHNGPERGTHVLGWWRGVARLRDTLGGVGARFDAIGAWVALDVHGGELAPLCPLPGGPAWYPRPHRGLFFDRSVHRVPEVVIPYRLPA